MSELPPLRVIIGPTAAGKSALAHAEALRTGAAIVSADSVQVYRGLDIGSAKPTTADRAAVPHHGLDLWPPTEQANTAAWLAAVTPTIAALHARDTPVIVCGGTGLWVRALLEGLAPIPEIPFTIRAQLSADLQQFGPVVLHTRLAAVDPEAARRIMPQDAQRITRALEVFLATGTPLTQLHAQHQAARRPRYAATLIGVFPDRALLERRIAERAHAMVAHGLVDEVQALLAQGLPPDAPGLQTLGYREVVAALQTGLPSRAELAQRLALAHRRYAKRQLTWWRDVPLDERVTPS